MMIQISDIGLLAIAMSITMIAAGVNLSIVFLANMVAVINATLIKLMVTETTSSTEVYMILLMCLGVSVAIGIIAGFINSFLIANLGIPPILVTLGTMNLFYGVAMIVTDGRGIIGFPQQLLDIGSGNMLGIPIPFIIFIVLITILYFVIHKTSYGMKLILVGTNSMASFFSGINNKKVLYITYIISCVFAALSGIMLMARTNSATVDYGAPIVLTTLLIGVLSGIKKGSGKDHVINIFLALLVMQLLNSGLNLLRVSSFIREMTPAALLVAIISLEHLMQARGEKRLNRLSLLNNTQGKGTAEKAG